MSKNTLLSELINYVSANASGNVTIAAPSSGYALDVNGTGRYTGQLTLGTTLSLNGGTLAGNNIVSMRANATGGQFRVEKSDGSLSAYPYYVGVDGTALAYYYNTAGVLKVLLHTDGTSYFGNNLSIGYATYSAVTYALDVNGTGRFTGALTGTSFSATDAIGSAILTTNGGGEGILSVNTANPLRVLINGGEKVRITSAGNVGIGTTSPLGGGGATDKTLSINSGSGAASFVTGLVGDVKYSTLFTASSIVVLETNAAIPLAFNTNGTERMRILSGGSVGIGTSSPSAKLHVEGNMYISDTLSLGNWFDANSKFSGYTTDGLFSANARPCTITTPSGSQRIKLGYFDYGGGQYYGRIGFAANTNWSLGTIGSPGNDFSIGTGASGQSLTITSAGNIGMAVTNPSHRLQVSGNIYSSDTVFARNLKPEAFASVSAGTPTGAGIPLGYSTLNITTLTDNNWRPIMTNINDVKGYFWVTLGDAASKDTANYMMAMTSPSYGVSNFGVVSYQNNGWNTGDFEFTTDTTGGSYRLLVRCTSYYSGSGTAYGTIYFLRLE
jgi:hypothetical protein